MAEAITDETAYEYNDDLIVRHARLVFNKVHGMFKANLRREVENADTIAAIEKRITTIVEQVRIQMEDMMKNKRTRNVEMFHLVATEHGLDGFKGDPKVFVDVCLKVMPDFLPELRLYVKMLSWQLRLVLNAIQAEAFNISVIGTLPNFIDSAPIAVANSLSDLKEHLITYQANLREAFFATFTFNEEQLDMAICPDSTLSDKLSAEASVDPAEDQLKKYSNLRSAIYKMERFCFLNLMHFYLQKFEQLL